MSVRTETPRSADREWWGRLPLLVTSPAVFFRGLRDETREAMDARQEPLLAVAIVAGIPMFLSLVALEPPYSRYDALSSVNLTLESVLGGMIVAVSNLWLGGLLLYLGTRGLGAQSGYRLARHIVGFGTAPFALALVLVWPVRLAIYGMSLFRAGGRDEGAGGDVFIGIDAAFLVWALVLVVIGVRETQAWPWSKALGAFVVAAVFALLFGTLAYAVTR